MSTPSFPRLAARSFPFVLGVALAAIAVPVLVVGISGNAVERELGRHGLVTEGTVLDKESTRVTHRKKGGGTETETTYSVRYRFAIGAGAAFEAERQVGEMAWKGLHQDGPVAIRYLPGDPTVNRLEAERTTGIDMLTGIGIGLAAVGLCGMALGVLSIRRLLHVLRNGATADARVSAVDARTVRGRTTYLVRYTFQDDKGVEQSGKSLPLTAAEASGWKEGSRARIRFDPQKPARNAWVGEKPSGR
jgi:hypothetical protein